MKYKELRKLIREEIEDTDPAGIITFEQVKQTCMDHYSTKKGIIEKAKNLDDLVNLFTNHPKLGWKEIETYKFILNSLIK